MTDNLREAIAQAIKASDDAYQGHDDEEMYHANADAVLAVVARYQQEHDAAIRQRIEALWARYERMPRAARPNLLGAQADVLEALAAPAPSPDDVRQETMRHVGGRAAAWVAMQGVDPSAPAPSRQEPNVGD